MATPAATILGASEFAAIGQSLMVEGEEIKGGGATTSKDNSSTRPIYRSKFTPKKIFMYFFLILLAILVAYQTLTQFLLKMIDNENVLSIISKYLERNGDPSGNFVLNDFVCSNNGTSLYCHFMRESKQ